MQKLQFNIISRDDWAQLANKQFGYFYFVVDDPTILNEGGDFYLGENLIGSGMTIEEIVEYFENPENEHTFPGLTVGDLVSRGDTALEISERFGNHAMTEKRYIKSGESKVLTIGGVTFDSNDRSTVLKCGLNTGSYQEWTGSTNNWLYVNGFNQFDPTMYKQGTDYLFVFPCVKGVPGKYGNPELGQNNGYVVVGGLETFVGYSSEPGFTPLQQSDFTELTGVRLEGQPQDDNHVYYMPPDVGWMCVGYSSQPTSTTNEDGSLKLTLNGTEVGCHLAMDNKMDNTAGGVYAKTIVFNIAEKNGIAASESGPGAYDDVAFNSAGYTYTRRLCWDDCGNFSWENDGGVYDETSGNYIWTWYASVDNMKPDGAFAITGGNEEMFIGTYTNGNEIRILSYGDESSSWNYPEDCSILYESADPEITTVDNGNGYQDFYASKYGVVSVIYSSRGDIDLVLEETGPYVKIEYQQSGGDQIWNAIAYQKEMAEVTAAALCDLDSRIDNLDVDFTPLQNQIDALSEQIEGIPQWIEYPDDEENPDYLTFTAEQAGSTISLSKVGTVSGVNNMEYSTNGGSDWTTYTFGTTLTLTNVGNTIMFRGDNRYGSSTNSTNYLNFSMTGKIAASGSSTSLYNKTGELRRNPGMIYANLFKNCTALTKAPKVCTTSAGTYKFYGMFQGCTSLIEPPAIIGDAVGQHTCEQMFYGCTSLIQAPELPALYVYDYGYKGMFQGCTALKIGPSVLPSTLNGRTSYGSSYSSSSCYQDMFNGCTSLIKAPDLPSKNTANYCYYQMFNGCTSLTTTPELPATTLATNCYYGMFQDCTSLTKAPSILPATTLATSCYNSMFRNCSSLTKAPELPDATMVLNCYSYMFQNCSNLNYIKAMFTTTPSATYMSNWVYGVSSTGTFVKNSAASWTNSFGVNAIPSNWTVTTASA